MNYEPTQQDIDEMILAFAEMDIERIKGVKNDNTNS